MEIGYSAYTPQRLFLMNTDKMNTEHKHTPGPWHVSKDQGYVGAIAHACGFIALPLLPRDVDETRYRRESWLSMRERTEPDREKIKNEKLANARLIAASPDLLELVRHALKEQMDLRPEYRDKWFVSVAEDTLARADGKGGA